MSKPEIIGSTRSTYTRVVRMVCEEKGIDYPIGFARWTAQRNLQAVLETNGNPRRCTGRFTTTTQSWWIF